jgi:flagellar biogenesis protein FliO
MLRTRFFLFLFACCTQGLCTSPLYSADNASPEQTKPFQQEETSEGYDHEESAPLQQVSDVTGLFIKTFSLLAGLCGLIIVGGYVLRRMGGPRIGTFGTGTAITLIERKYISPKTSVWLIKVHEEPVVIVDSQNGVAIHSLKTQSPHQPNV